MSNDIPPEVCETLKQLGNENEENFDIAFYDTNEKGEGFFGEIIFVTLRNKKTNNELKVIVKQAFRDQSIRDSFLQKDIFMNEIHFYSKIWPTLDKFQEQIPIKYRFQKIPKCFATVCNESFEYLVLENLKFQNFQMHDRKQPLGKEYYELIFREYGKFHGLSFAYKALHPREYADLAKGLVDLYSAMHKQENFHKTIKYTYEVCFECLQPGVDDAVIEKLRPYLQNCQESFIKVLQTRTNYTVITHGDCWSNNMMFKYDDSKKVTDVRFLDFQLAKVASPCCDLSYCIYSGATKEVLKDLDYYLQVYHDSLSETLKQFGCDSEKLYPLQTLKEDWKIFCEFGLTLALMIWKMKFTYDDEMKTLADLSTDELHEVVKLGYDKDAFSKSVKDLFYHLYEKDLL